MSITENDILSKIQVEFEQLVSASTVYSQTIEALEKKRTELGNKLQLIDPHDASQQDNASHLRNELTTLVQEYNQKTKELKEINEKLFLLKMNLKFQNDILDLWDKEEYYRSLLDEKGMTPNEALLQLQAYVMPTEISDQLMISSMVKDYARIGRQDIAELIMGLSDPSKRCSIFAKAKECYFKTPDYNYGLILTLCYEYGWGTEINKKAALEIDKRFAAENHPLALCAMAGNYFDGDLIERDDKKAVEYYERATCAEQQTFYYPHFRWGKRSLDGQCVKKDETRGLRLLQLADEKGIDLACVALVEYFCEKAEFLENPQNNAAGSDIKQAQERAYFYAKKTNDSISPLGKLFLAQCHGKGWGVNQDLQQFFTLINQAAALGVDQAFENLANLYQSGIPGILEPNPIQALKLYFESFRRNCLADHDLNAFKTFLSQNQNNHHFMETTFDLCKKCLQGHLLDNPLDSTIVGLFYQQGVLLPRNLGRAIACFQKGADLGSAGAANTLVLISSKGESEGLLPPSIAAKYLSYTTYTTGDDEVSVVREHYRSAFTPLFQTLNEIWPNVGLGSNGMPAGITRLIRDYAYTPPDPDVPSNEKQCSKI